VRIDGARVVVHESSGALITELQGTGMAVVPEVLAAKDKDGKGATTIGKFKKLTDAELLNAIARNKTYDAIGLQLACFPVPDGAKDTMELKAKLPAPGVQGRPRRAQAPAVRRAQVRVPVTPRAARCPLRHRQPTGQS